MSLTTDLFRFSVQRVKSWKKMYISICLTTFAIMTYNRLYSRDSIPATQQSTSSSIYIILSVNLLTKVKKFVQCFAI